MNHFLRVALLGAGALLLSGCITKQTVGNSATVDGTLQVCSSCHGQEGRSRNATFPILAAQQKTYLVTQLKAFRGKTRADPHAHTYMWGMAAKLDDNTIDGVASFFSAQSPSSGQPGDPSLILAGQDIFLHGMKGTGVPACMLCHGAQAGGRGGIPRLAGQHQEYLAEQLYAFKNTSRANVLMHANARNLTPEEIQQITTYLASL